MIRTILRSLCIAIAVAWWVGAGSVAAASELALKRVMLSTGGVGYFEYEAQVEGDAVLKLEVRLDQVDGMTRLSASSDAAATEPAPTHQSPA